jgi:hypothetical protein
MKRDAVLILRLPLDVKSALQAAGEADAGRSMSGMGVKILSEWLGEHGFLRRATEKPRKARS